MTPYRIESLAQNDLDEIWSYVARDSIAAADRLITLFQQKFLLLSSQPFLGESRKELQRDIRSFVVGNYVVYYRPAKNGIEVARVIHGARDVRAQFED